MSDPELSRNDILALDRTRLAADRTLMAWVRTALSMITFGFTIYKFLEALYQQSTVPILRPNAPRSLGLILIGIGTFAVIAACVQHWDYIKKLSPAYPFKPWGLAFIVACLIALLGLPMFGSIILRWGPLG
jgi:putative membrane protein